MSRYVLSHIKSIMNNRGSFLRKQGRKLPLEDREGLLMQSYPTRALDRRLQVDWARDPREGPKVLMSLRVVLSPWVKYEPAYLCKY